ncbi:response regulator [bacterium]|nr:response regulator [bacterium]
MNKANILIVDDEYEIRDLCSKLLRQKSYYVESAKNGEEGLTMLANNFFDLVLLDLKMPGLNGIEVLKQIKKNNIKTDSIILTGYATIETAVEAMRLGSFDYISKPFNLSQLNTTVEQCINKRLADTSIPFLKKIPSFADTDYNLKTSINSIITDTNSLLNEWDKQEPSPQQIFKKININSKNLLRMINNLLDLSRIAMHKTALSWEKIQLKNIVEEIISYADPLLKEKNILVKTYIDSNLPFIISDKSHIKQILLNTLNYTIKFSSQRKLIVSILNATDKKTIEIIIGPLRTKHLQKNFIFSPPKTADDVALLKYTEMDTNLNLAKNLTEYLGGTFKIESISNNDSNFIFTFPSQPSRQEKETKKNLIVIDVNPAVINRIRDFTKKTQYQVVGCLMEKETLKQIVTTTPFAIILDIVTAEYDHGTILKDLKNNPETASTPIIVISSSKMKPLTFSYKNKNFLINPIKKTQLLKKLDALKQTNRIKSMILSNDGHTVDLLGNFLENENHIVLSSQNKQEAIEKIYQEKPDIIFLDLINLKEVSFNLLTEISNDPLIKNIHLVLLNNEKFLFLNKSLTSKQIQGFIIKEELAKEKTLNKLEKIITNLKKKRGE